MPNATSSSKRPLIFLGVGALNTLLDFAFYSLLTLTVFNDGRHIALAGIISGTFALFCAFLTHSLITWRGSDISRYTILKFIGFTGFGMWIIRPILLTQFIHFSTLYRLAYKISNSIGLPFSYDFIVSTGTFGFMVIIVLLYNYYVYKRFVFTNSEDKTADQTSQ